MTMQITRLEISDFKRIETVALDVSGNVITIGGNNAQGKSSVLDAIWNCLAGKQRAIERPIRDGAKKASIEVTVADETGGGYVITRNYTPTASTIKVTPLDNPAAKLAKPQAVLDAIIGKFAFDPLEFATQDKKAQLKTLLDLVELDFDLNALEAERAEAYEERTIVGRERKRAIGALETMGPRPSTEGDAISVSVLAAELQAANTVEQQLATRRKEFRDLQEQMDALNARLENIRTEGEALVARQAALRSPKEIEADIEAAEERNHAHARLAEWDAAAEGAKRAEGEWEALTAKIADLDAMKSEGLARANFPITDLSFDTDGVLYRGVPFTQASAAEQIRVSVAMAIAMNPELKVICVKDATLLDPENQELLRQLAADHGFQLFLEMVGASKDWSLVLSEGKAVPSS